MYFNYRNKIALMGFNIGTPKIINFPFVPNILTAKIINFPFGTNGKLMVFRHIKAINFPFGTYRKMMILGVPILKLIRVRVDKYSEITGAQTLISHSIQHGLLELIIECIETLYQI